MKLIIAGLSALFVSSTLAQEWEIHSDRNWCRYVNAGTHFESGKGRRCDRWEPASILETGAVVPQCDVWVYDSTHNNDYLVNSVRIYRGKCKFWSIIEVSTWVSVRCDASWKGKDPTGSMKKRGIDAPPSRARGADAPAKAKREDPDFFRDAHDQDKWLGEPNARLGHTNDWLSIQPFDQHWDEVGWFDDHKGRHDPLSLGSADEWIDPDPNAPAPDAEVPQEDGFAVPEDERSAIDGEDHEDPPCDREEPNDPFDQLLGYDECHSIINKKARRSHSIEMPGSMGDASEGPDVMIGGEDLDEVERPTAFGIKGDEDVRTTEAYAAVAVGPKISRKGVYLHSLPHEGFRPTLKLKPSLASTLNTRVKLATATSTGDVLLLPAGLGP